MKLRKIIKYVVDSFKTDFDFVKRLVTGKAEDEVYGTLDGLKKADYGRVIKENYPIFLVAFACFFLGMFFAAKIYEVKCNNMIITIVNDVNKRLYPTDQRELVDIMAEMGINTSRISMTGDYAMPNTTSPG